MFAVCSLVLLGIWIIPKIRESKGNAAWEKTSTEEKWKFYLDALRKMNWDTFQFGSYNLKDWHYDEVIGFLDRLESGVYGYVNGFTQEQISKSNLVLYGGTNNV